MKMQLSPEQERLVLENKRLSFYIAKKYNIDNYDYDDIVSLANIGLIKAAITYSDDKGTKFVTYAARCMDNEIRMVIRKEVKYQGRVSLDDAISSDDSIFLKDVIPDPESDFTIEVELDDENASILKNLIEITLNEFKGKTRLANLYYIAGKRQHWIAKKVGISQSYVARLEKRLITKIKTRIEREPKEYNKECFRVDITKRGYRVTFSSKEAINFNKVFARILRNTDSSKYIPNFKISRNQEQVSITMFEDIQCLQFIADIIQEIENFELSLKIIEPISEPEEETSTNEPGNSEKSALVEKEPENNVDQDEEKKEKIFPKIIASFLEKDEFTVAQIREEFPNVDGSYVGYCAHVAKKSGLIIPIKRGKYSVVKKANAKE